MEVNGVQSYVLEPTDLHFNGKESKSMWEWVNDDRNDQKHSW